MGLCLSCIRPDYDNEDEFNERSSLLGNQHLHSDENIQEELLKQQQRQQELNGIVNELNDNLIDVSTFLSDPVVSNGTIPAANLSYLTNSLQPQTTNEENGTALAHEQQEGIQGKQYPYVLSPEEKQKILQEVESLDSSVKEASKITCDGLLYLDF
ncbi:hypothetical protein HYPBUDRAFT_152486 [Hyphopichia burtonii NRRL Y-1933]|uniref:Uncharacterized protein n=1 Tax=Hyphopichia burtonii NRRL Y-1933 TaxID=984485 RepID=A0A1E4RK53_9ASCO|nr:hypothetical protein HYPBUDRAFT_152486 [Hyphopichia burtonii NRRL Y-1933]ODV67623.1 hypothetical protein HYPBUDRAFT_152486 [Hyphopichia burtonii NRRL Y-1933]